MAKSRNGEERISPSGMGASMCCEEGRRTGISQFRKYEHNIASKIVAEDDLMPKYLNK